MEFFWHCFTGRLGAHFHGGLHNRDVHKNSINGLHFTQEQLHEKPLEYYGFCRCHFSVSPISL